MAELGAGNHDRGLWHRWHALQSSDAPAPDALALAAYAEGRLSEAEAERVENWLAAYPGGLADVIAARAVPQQPSSATADMIARACALVARDAAAAENVVPLRRAPPQWRNALAWSSVAASLVAASFVGFAMGSDAYQNLAPTPAAESSYVDALEISPSLDSWFSDDTGT
jgi:hypothetical protein